ncbi:hypothetical protein WDU94_006367 [Cyamophila willieti]
MSMDYLLLMLLLACNLYNSKSDKKQETNGQTSLKEETSSVEPSEQMNIHLHRIPPETSHKTRKDRKLCAASRMKVNSLHRLRRALNNLYNSKSDKKQETNGQTSLKEETSSVEPPEQMNIHLHRIPPETCQKTRKGRELHRIPPETCQKTRKDRKLSAGDPAPSRIKVNSLHRLRRHLTPRRRKAMLRRKKMEERRRQKAQVLITTTTTEEPPFRKNLSRIHKIMDQMSDAWCEENDNMNETDDMDVDNMNISEIIRQDSLVPILLTTYGVYTVCLTASQSNVHCLHRIRRNGERTEPSYPPTQATFPFNAFLKDQMEKLERKNDTKAVQLLLEKIYKSRVLQERHLAFSKRVFTAERRGDKLNYTKREYEANMKHLNEISGFIGHLRSSGLSEPILLNRTTDKLMEYWFTHVVRNRL